MSQSILISLYKHSKIFAILCVLAFNKGWAYDFSIGGIYYNIIDPEKMELEVAPLSADFSYNNNAYSGTLVLPETVSFANYSFTVTAIGANAFSQCVGLKEISLPTTITNLGSKCFEGCSGLTNIVFPSSLSIIGVEAFSGCTSLSNVKFAENSVSEIQAGAFMNCKSLNEIILPFGVSRLCGEVFKNCSSLKVVEIPNSVCYIGAEAFAGCCSMLDVSFPLSVTKIESCAFENCIGLSRVYIPETLLEIGPGAFKGCRNLRTIDVATDNSAYTSVKGILYDKEKTTLHTCPCGYVGEISILNSALFICDYAFSGCLDLTEINIPKNVRSIGSQAFANCERLYSCSIPSSVVTIGERAFFNTLWYKIQPDGLVYAGQVVYCFKGEMSKEYSVELRESTVGIADCAFQKCVNLSSIILPNKLLSIGFAAFDSCTNLMSVDIPKSVSIIGDQAFYNCTNLTVIHCRCSNLPSIGSYTFYQCSTDSCILYVPSKMKATFEAADVWKDFKNIRVEE